MAEQQQQQPEKRGRWSGAATHRRLSVWGLYALQRAGLPPPLDLPLTSAPWPAGRQGHWSSRSARPLCHVRRVHGGGMCHAGELPCGRADHMCACPRAPTVFLSPEGLSGLALVYVSPRRLGPTCGHEAVVHASARERRREPTRDWRSDIKIGSALVRGLQRTRTSEGTVRSLTLFEFLKVGRVPVDRAQ